MKFQPILTNFLSLAFVNIFAKFSELSRQTTAQHDIRSPARHVGGDGHSVWPARLGDDDCFAFMLFGIEYFVLYFILFEEVGKQF